MCLKTQEYDCLEKKRNEKQGEISEIWDLF